MIRASSPCRVDLAGGTLDIWPICHVLKHPAVTVNAAVDLRAHAEVEETADGHLEVEALDRGERIRLPVDSLTHETLGLATLLAEWFGPGDGLRIRLRSDAPPQSGLGGSSAMAIALAGALGRLRGKAFDIPTVQNLETRLLQTPTGYQDYYPPLLGGIHALTARPDAVAAERIDAGPLLKEHLLLVDTRIEHHSGLTNWEVVKRFFDGDPAARDGLERIAVCAAALRDALEARNLAGVADALDREWRARRTLSPVVTNERIETLARTAREAGALASKVCGAGGGGCMVVVADEPSAIADALRRAGGTPLSCAPDHEGLIVGDR